MINPLKHIKENPVFLKEMRVGFREKKVFYALLAWVVLVALAASMAALYAFNDHQGIDNLPESGMYFMEVLFWIQMALLAMLSPSLTTSAVSGEKERKSFDMLLTTHLAPWELIYGKFGFAASFIMLALCATIPLESIVFFLGGVSLTSFFLSKLILCTFGFLCALFGLMMSARESRSAYATGQTYLSLIFICWFGGIMLAALRYAGDEIHDGFRAAAAVTVFYIALFLFWKAVNHTEERARHLVMLLTTGLIFYLLVLAGMGFSHYYYPGFDDSIWLLSGPIHYYLFGVMLNPMRPSRKIEQERFEKSLLSRPFFWTVLFSVGLLVPLIFVEDDKALAICMYGLVSGFSSAWFARSLALGRENRYPQFLAGTWLLLNVLPAITTIEQWTSGNHHWHPASVSPIVMLTTYIDYSPHPMSLPFFAIAFYGILAVYGQIRHMRFAARLKSSS